MEPIDADREGKTTKTREMLYEMKVGDVMTRKVITVHRKNFMSQLRNILHHNRISGLPVVEEERLAGLVSIEDFIKWLADRADDCPIEERMTQKLETLYDDEPLVLAIGKFERTGLGRFPVIERDCGRLVGLVTKGDVIQGLLKKLESEYHEEQVRRHRASHIFEDIEADDAILSFQYDVKARDFKQAGASASRLKTTLQRLGVRPDVVRRVAIASYEAEMNLVVFTEGGKIRAQVQPARVVVEVDDSGPGIADIEKALEPGYSTASDWVRELGFGAGMGLNNIQKSSDQFDIQSELGKGTHLKIVFLTNGLTDETG